MPFDLEPFWRETDQALHDDADQLKRRASASEVEICPELLDIDTGSALIKTYVVSPQACSCRDFAVRRLPCKHMYRLAHELGVFDLDCDKLYGIWFAEEDSAPKASRLSTPSQLIDLVAGLPLDVQLALCDALYTFDHHPEWSDGCAFLSCDRIFAELVSSGLITPTRRTKVICSDRPYLWTALEHDLHAYNIQHIKSNEQGDRVTLTIDGAADARFVRYVLSTHFAPYRSAIYRRLRALYPWPASLDEHGNCQLERRSTRLYLPTCPHTSESQALAGETKRFAVDDRFFDGFAWAVPKSFASALSICRFEQGDVLYNSRLAYGYGQPWASSAPHVSHSIQVQFPPRHSTPREDDADASDSGTPPNEHRPRIGSFERHWNHSVSFILTDHKSGDSRLIATTQGRLYSMLRTGDMGWIGIQASDPPLPLQAADLLRSLPNSPVIHAGKRPIAFVMPYDHLSALLFQKRLAIQYALSSHYIVSTRMVKPDVCSLFPGQYYAPTVCIARFEMIGAHAEDVAKILKDALYKPTGNSDRFSLSRHGCLQSC